MELFLCKKLVMFELEVYTRISLSDIYGWLYKEPFVVSDEQ